MTTASVSGTLGNVQLIAFAEEASLAAVRAAAQELGFTRTNIVSGKVAEATEYLKQHASPEILLVEIGSPEQAAKELDALANFVNPHTKVLATGKVDSIRFYHWLSDLGIEGYLLQPFTAAELKQAIAKGAIKRQAAADDKSKVLHKVIAVIGARGGVGTTMVATNLAAVFAKDHQLNTALVDLDAHYGAVALALDLEPGRGLRDAFEKPDRVDALFLERVMVKPFPMLSALAAEEPLTDSIQTQPNAGEMILAALKEKFQVVVLDVPRQMNPLTRYFLAQAEHTVIVAESQITSLRDSLRIRDFVVDHLKRPEPMLLLNRVGLSGSNELPPKEFAKNYGHAVTAQLAFSHEAIAASAEGTLMMNAPKLGAALGTLKKLAKSMIGDALEDEDDEKSGGKSLLGRLKGGR